MVIEEYHVYTAWYSSVLQTNVTMLVTLSYVITIMSDSVK